MRAGIAIALAGIALVGCGSGRAVDDDILAEAAAQTLDAGSSRLAVRVVDPGSATMTASALIDYRTPKGRATMDVSATEEEGGNFATEVILVRKTLYVKVDEDEREFMGGKQWFKVDLSEGGDDRMFGPFGNDPNDLLKFLRETSDVVHVGPDDVRGSSAERYRGRLDLDAVIEKFPADDRRELRQELDRADPTLRKDGLPLEFWIDDQGFLRRVHVAIPQKKKEPATATIDFFDFGTSVEIEPPPADQVHAFDDMYESEEGEAEGVAPELTPEQEKCLEEATDEEVFEKCFENRTPKNGEEK